MTSCFVCATLNLGRKKSTGTEPCLWRWEPDRRSNFFFNPPAHLCAVTYMTEISLVVTLNNQFTAPQTNLQYSKHIYLYNIVWIHLAPRTWISSSSDAPPPSCASCTPLSCGLFFLNAGLWVLPTLFNFFYRSGAGEIHCIHPENIN